MFPCAQTVNTSCTGRTEIIHCGRSFPVLPFRFAGSSAGGDSTAAQRGFSQTDSEGFSTGLGVPVPWQSWEMPSLSSRGGASLPPELLLLGWAGSATPVILGLLSVWHSCHLLWFGWFGFSWSSVSALMRDL